MSVMDLPDRPLLIERVPSDVHSSRPRFHSPPVELPSSNARNFFEEAKIHPIDETELKKKFNKFARTTPEHAEPVLTLEEFCCLLQQFEICPPHHYEAYFYAMDRNHDDMLDFQEFFLGCCAADPTTVHILNSFTGYERAQYIFDFFDVNRSATLEFNEFARLTAESLSLQLCNPNDENVRRQAIEQAKELGALEDAGHLLHFTCIKFKKFYEHIHTEKLRGTSRLFRFGKSIIKNAKRNSKDDRGREEERLDTERLLSDHAQRKAMDDQTAWWNFLLDEFEHGEDEAPLRPPPSEGPYTNILPPAPPPNSGAQRSGLVTSEAQNAAVAVLETLLVSETIDDYAKNANSFTLLTPSQINHLCQAVIRQLQGEPMVINVEGPCKVFGSIHGQLWDLLSFFSIYGMPHMKLSERGDLAYTNYIFLGDYGDRGKYSLEVILLLFSLKYVYPANILLLRGHHENRDVNYHLGLRQECERRFPNALDAMKVFDVINRTFEYLSVAALVNQEIICIHSGIHQSLNKMDQLKAYKKPLTLPHPSVSNATITPLERFHEQLLLEMFISPSFLPHSAPSEAARFAYARSVDLAEQFCAANRLSLVIRSRYIPRRGASLVQSGKLFTVASACDLIKSNEAAMLHIVLDPPGTSIKARRLTTRSFSLANQRTFKVPQHLCGNEQRWEHPRDLSPGRWVDDPQALQLTLADRLEWIVAADDAGPCHALDANNLADVRRNRRLDAEAMAKELVKEEKPATKSNKSKRELSSNANSPSGEADANAASKAASSTPAERRKHLRSRGAVSSDASMPKLIPHPKSTRLRNVALTKNKTMTFSIIDKEIKDVGLLSLEKIADPSNAPFLWRLWQQAGWNEKHWKTAISIFEQEITEQLDCRQDLTGWTLETFSMWLLKSGRWLRECNLWFNAFDFDHDGVISPADLLVGFLVTRAKCTGSLFALRTLGIMRLFMAEKDQPRTPVLTQTQFQALLQEVSKFKNPPIKAEDVHTSMQFPMEHVTFTLIAFRLDLDNILKLHIPGVGP